MNVRLLTITSVVSMSVALAACSKQRYQQPETSGMATTTTATYNEQNRPKPMPAFVEFDRNGDMEVTKEEFQQALTETNFFGDLDGDGDGELTDVEFETSFYRAWDINGDEKVDVDEYKDGSGAYFHSANAYGEFVDYDNDGDKELSMTEYSTLAGQVFDDWDSDGDGELTDLEFRTSLYNAWDLNGDGVIDHYEYRWK